MINLQTGIECSLYIGYAISQSKGDFLHSSGTSFADMVAGNGNGVKGRGMLRTPLKDIRDQSQAGLWRKDIGSPGDIFF